MNDAFESDTAKNVLESIARRIPGFAGYLDKEERRDSDAMARRWLADRLDAIKPHLDTFTRKLTDQGQLDELTKCGKLRNRIELMISRLRGATSGYSDFFDRNEIDEDRLDDILEHDLSIVDQADQVTVAIERLGTEQADLAAAETEVQLLESRFSERARLLSSGDIGA